MRVDRNALPAQAEGAKMRNIWSVCYAGAHLIQVLLHTHTHTPLDGCRPASHDVALRMRLTDGWLCVLYTLSICISTSSQPLSISLKTRPLQADKVGLGRTDRLSEGRQGCFRAPITYALKNFSLAAIIQELLFAREGMRNRKRVNEESQRVD